MAEIFFGDLVQILESIQHHDQDIRRKGEIDYHELQNQGNYVEIVTKFAVDDSKPVHFRQLIVVLLNQQISKDWRSFTQSSKGSLVQFSFDGCRNQVAILRTSCMHMLSKIVSRSSDSETRDILVYLSGQLTSLDVFIVTSTLKALCAIAEEDGESHIEIIRQCYRQIHIMVAPSDQSNIQLLRYSSKLVRLCIQKLGDARMACGLNEASNSVIAQFLPVWSKLVVQILGGIKSIIDITSKIAAIIELLRSVSIALEAFPDDCEEVFPDCMRIAWNLLCPIRDDCISKRSGVRADIVTGYTSDGDRIDFQALVIHLFELLTIGLSASVLNAKKFLGGDLDQLISVLADHMQLSEELQEQWNEDGNEFVASEQDEFSEYSVRHSGGELLTQICKGGKERSFRYIFHPSILEDLSCFSTFNTAQSINSKALSASTILRMESVMWCVGCLGVAYTRHYRLEERYRRRAGRDTDDSFEAPDAKERTAIVVISAIPSDDVVRVISIFAKTILIDPLRRSPHPAHAVLRGRAVWLLSAYATLFERSLTEAICEACLLCIDQCNPLTVRLQSCRALAVIVTKTSTSAYSSDHSPLPDLFSSKGNGMAFGLAVIESTLNLLPLMSQSTMHYALELVTLTLKRFLVSGIDGSGSSVAAAVGASSVRLVQAGLKVLSSYCTDPMLLDVSKDMFMALSNTNVCTVAVYEYAVPQFQQWLVLSSVGRREEGGVNRDTHSSVPPSLVDVTIQILSGLCMSSSLPLLSSTAHTQAEVVLTCLHTLLSTMTCNSHPCRREGMQATNCILSHYQGRVRDMFIPHNHPPHSPPISTPHQFSQTLAELIMFTLKGCDADPGSFSECSGPCAGLLCHLLVNFSGDLSLPVVNAILGATLHSLRCTTSTYVKYSLLMGLIHLFARNAPLLANASSPLLGMLPPLGTGAGAKATGALGYVLDEWCLLHPHLTSKYRASVSVLGFIELIKMFNLSASNHGFALKILQLALETLPRILLNPDGADDEDAALDGTGDEDQMSDDSGEEEWESEGEYDEDGDGQYDDMDAMTGEMGAGNKATQSPFAPAEMYLSDMIGPTGKLGDDENLDHFLVVNISSHLVFSPPNADPLYSVDLQGRIIDLLVGLKSTDSKGLYPAWMNALSAKDQYLIEALVESR